MIDPVNITRYNLSKEELEETILFCICVAGKNALATAKALDKFLKKGHSLVYFENYSFKPFEMLECLFLLFNESVPTMLRNCGIGCYNRRAKSLREIVSSGLDLKTCTTKDLEKIPGIGMKTSRYFILHTRGDAKVVPIDTHALKYLRDQGVISSTKVSLTPKNYLWLEKEYIKSWKKNGKDLTLAAFDLGVWNHYAGHKKDFSLLVENDAYD